MGKVTESIYSDGTAVVPMADVQHIEKLKGYNEGALWLIMKSTRYDMEADTWSNPVLIGKEEAAGFLRAWCQYRNELEGKDLITITHVPDPKGAYGCSHQQSDQTG